MDAPAGGSAHLLHSSLTCRRSYGSLTPLRWAPLPYRLLVCLLAGKEIILLCENGGSLQNKPGTQWGFQSRSLKAYYFLKQAGAGNAKLFHMQGGIAQWQRDKLPMGDDADDDDDGVGGAAASAMAPLAAVFSGIGRQRQ